MTHEESNLFLVGAVEVGPVGTGQVLREVDQVPLVLMKGRRADACVIAFDRLADQLLVAESHS
ncbi:MAG TPA: hypothetical protein VJL81_14495 [Solirubrobacterales bacterium]|nr:hypothetical protein [Solirubrobacterales bacterium]